MIEAQASGIMLARAQFGANITFHILFPTISIGLGWMLVYFRLKAGGSQDDRWIRAYGFWVKVFALTFALGVVSGITMSFQFGTNWPGFMQTVGNVAGPLLAYEVLTAFFLEATFLGVMLFGAQRVSPRMHTLSAFLVATGTTLSAFWIIVLNSWMHTPAGFRMVHGQAEVTNWFEVVFNPSFPYRLVHMLLASGLTTAFLVAGVSAYRWRQGQRSADVSAALRSAMILGACLIPLQIAAGDLQGLNTLAFEPAKVAAMEGLWNTEKGAPAVIFAWPDERTGQNRFELAIPRLASLYLRHSLDGQVQGLKDFAEHPPVVPVFIAFRLMVGVGLLMLAVSWLGVWQFRRRGALSEGMMKLVVLMSFSGWIPVVCGWYVTEIGRQPWLVTGVLTTAQAASPVPPHIIAATLAMYLVLYGFLTVSYVSVVFHLARKADRPPVRRPARLGVAHEQGLHHA
jgi:cytochrome d ubiquinol oxidase subunit I